MSKILIIEDDPTTRLILQADLELEGYKVNVAENGKDGIEKAQMLRPSVIISDWMMPIMDGLETCRKLKTDQNLAITSFILLTSRNSLEDLVAALDAGVDEFISKPVETHELHARVRSAIRQYELKRMFNVTNQQLTRTLQQLRKNSQVQVFAESIQQPVQTINSNLSELSHQLKDLLTLIKLYQKHYPQPHADIQNQIETMELKSLLKNIPQLFNSLKEDAKMINNIVNTKNRTSD